MTWTSDRKTGYFWKHYGHRSGPSISAQEVSHAVITAAMRVHFGVGAGLLESAYQACLQHELDRAGIQAAGRASVVYRGARLETGYRTELLIEDLVIVEI